MKRLLLGVMAACAAGCGCPKKVPGETPPSNLADEGLVLDKLDDGARVEGRWISVSGWFDPAEVAMVAVLGASVDGFYESGGHVGVPSVFLTMRKDGRFVAPRVPVVDGENRISVVAISRQGRALSPIKRTVTASNVEKIPATLVAQPEKGIPGQPVKLRATTGTVGERSWQWDYDGDGTFDEEAAEPTHTWANPGRFNIVARTQVDGAWVYAVAGFTVAAEAKVIFSTAEVSNPSVLRVWGGADTGEPPTRVVAIDGNEVKLFDARLSLVRTLRGLSKPVDLVALGNDIVVLDRGADELVRFDEGGNLVTRFGTNGRWKPARAGALTEALSVVSITGYAQEELSFEFPSGGGYAVSFEPDGGVREFEDDGAYSVKNECFRAPFSSPRGLIEGGKLCRDNRVVERKGVEFVSLIESPQPVIGDFWLLDSSGKLHLYRTGAYDSTWQLEYPISAAASGMDGRVYTAGKGVLELRDLPFLRWKGGQ